MHKVVHWIGKVCCPIQFLVAAGIIYCYFFNDDFKKKPGSIILGFAISALIISFIGGLEHYLEFAKNICESVGFFALFSEYNCLYYEFGFIEFFIYDFAQLIYDKFPPISIAVSQIQSQNQTPIVNEDPELNRNPQHQIQEDAPNNFPQREQIKQKFDHLGRICQGIKEREVARTRCQKSYEQRLKEAETLFHKKQKSDHDFSRTFLQTKINVTVNLLSLASALVPLFCDHLGPNMFGGCSEIFDKDQSQNIRMGFYVILAALNAILSAYGLISFLQQRERLQKNALNHLRPLRHDEELRAEIQKADRYLNDAFWFIGVTAACCFIFSGLNIYAALTVLNSSDKEKINEWNEWKWDFLVFLHLLQGAVALFFKLHEAIVLDAMKIVYKNHWRILKEFVKKLCCCSHGRDTVSAQESFANPGINDTAEPLMIET